MRGFFCAALDHWSPAFSPRGFVLRTTRCILSARYRRRFLFVVPANQSLHHRPQHPHNRHISSSRCWGKSLTPQRPLILSGGAYGIVIFRVILESWQAAVFGPQECDRQLETGPGEATPGQLAVVNFHGSKNNTTSVLRRLRPWGYEDAECGLRQSFSTAGPITHFDKWT